MTGAHLLGKRTTVAGSQPLGPITRIGRAPDNEFRLTAPDVEPYHARVVLTAGTYTIEAASRTSALTINGRAIKDAPLRHLDVVGVGPSTDLVFLDDGSRTAATTPATPTVETASFEWLDGPDRGQVCEIPLGELTIGRAASCGVVIDAMAVSRAHARLVFSREGLMIEDLGSANGTMVGERAIVGPARLASGDRVTVGRLRTFRIAINWAGSSASPSEPAARKIDTGDRGSEPTVVDREWRTRLMSSVEHFAVLESATPLEMPRPAPTNPPADPTVRGSGSAAAVEGIPQVQPDAALPVNAIENKTVFRRGAPDLPPVFGEAAAGKTTVGRPGLGPPQPPPGLGGDTAVLPGPVVAPEQPPIFGDTPTTDVALVAVAGARDRFVLVQGTNRVGRSLDAEVNIASRTVSRKHATLQLSGTKLTVDDGGSGNGTFVNGEAVTGQQPLKEGDKIMFGDVEFDVRMTAKGQR